MENKKEIEKILDEATLKALNDSSFKERLLVDFNSEVKKEFNFDLPFKVTLHESTPEHLIFILPSKPDTNAELDDDKLEDVLGGVGGKPSNDLINKPRQPVKAAYAVYPDSKILF